MDKVKIKAFIGLLIATFLWGMSYVFSKGLIEAQMGSIPIIFFRSLIASITLISIMWLTKSFQIIKKEHMKTMLLLSLFQPFLYFIFELYSMKFNSPTLTSLIISLVPLFIPFALFITEKIRVEPKVYIAIVMSIVGVSIILLAGGSLDNLTSNPLGILLAFLAMICAVVYGIVARQITKHYSALVITSYQNMIGFVLFTPIFFITEFDTMSQIPLNSDTITSLLLLGVFCSAFAFMLYLNAIKHLGVLVSTITNNITPIFTVIGAYFIFSERLYPIQILGILITVSSLFIGTLFRSKGNKNVERTSDK